MGEWRFKIIIIIVGVVRFSSFVIQFFLYLRWFSTSPNSQYQYSERSCFSSFLRSFSSHFLVYLLLFLSRSDETRNTISSKLPILTAVWLSRELFRLHSGAELKIDLMFDLFRLACMDSLLSRCLLMRPTEIFIYSKRADSASVKCGLFHFGPKFRNTVRERCVHRLRVIVRSYCFRSLRIKWWLRNRPHGGYTSPESERSWQKSAATSHLKPEITEISPRPNVEILIPCRRWRDRSIFIIEGPKNSLTVSRSYDVDCEDADLDRYHAISCSILLLIRITPIHNVSVLE